MPPKGNKTSEFWRWQLWLGTERRTSYNFPGSGTMTTRVTLSYHFTNGTYQNVRCYITWYEPGVGGWPVPEVNGGTCAGFN